MTLSIKNLKINQINCEHEPCVVFNEKHHSYPILTLLVLTTSLKNMHERLTEEPNVTCWVSNKANAIVLYLI